MDILQKRFVLNINVCLAQIRYLKKYICQKNECMGKHNSSESSICCSGPQGGTDWAKTLTSPGGSLQNLIHRGADTSCVNGDNYPQTCPISQVIFAEGENLHTSKMLMHTQGIIFIPNEKPEHPQKQYEDGEPFLLPK